MSDFLFEDFASELDTIEVSAPSRSYEKLPAGEHNVEVTKAMIKDFDDDAQISLLLVSVGGDYDGASAWVNFPVRKPSHPKVEEIAKQQFKRVVMAAGLDKIKDVEDLVGATFGVTIEYYQDKYVRLNRVHTSVANPTKRSAASETEESDNVFDRF